MGRSNAVNPSPTVSEEETTPYLKQSFVVSDWAAKRLRYHKKERGHLPFNVHGSFSSGATRELLQLLVEEVKRVGGNFTAAHIANASNWQEVWSSKLEAADRVIVVWDKAYKARFTLNCKWEHDLIYEKATRWKEPIRVHFVDDDALEDPTKLRAWLGRVVKDDRKTEERMGVFPLTKEERGALLAANMDTVVLEEWHAWCTDPSNCVDHDPSARGEALGEIERLIEEGNAAAIEETKSELKKASQQKSVFSEKARPQKSACFPWDLSVQQIEYELKLLEEEPEFLRSNLDTWRQNVAAREGAAAVQPEEEDLGLTPTGAVVEASPPLRRIVQTGDVDQVRSALDSGADVNGADTFHMTAAHYAAQNGHAEVLNLLIERGANVIDAENKFGRTPIFLAAGMGHMFCVQTLKDAGAKIGDIVSTPDLEKALREAAKKGNVGTVKTMIDNGVVDLNAGASEDGTTALMMAVAEGKVECVEVLIGGGADVNVGNNRQNTALMWAAMKGSPECVDLLVKAGADVSLKDNYDEEDTALMKAVKKGSPECVDLLIKAGADVSLKDKYEITALMKAAKMGSPECVDLLIKAGADVSLEDKYERTALMKAAKMGSPECVDLLIKAGADLNLKDRDGKTALSLAKNSRKKFPWEDQKKYEEMRADQIECIALLKAAGAKEGACCAIQ